MAQLHRLGELTSVWVPKEEDEALRDLARAREDAKQDLLRARQRVSHFLLRHGLHAPTGTKSWSTKHRLWLYGLDFQNPALKIVFQEYLQQSMKLIKRIKRFEREIHLQATESAHAPVIQALQTLRGIVEVTAVTLVAEIGQFTRFRNPKQLMAYTGLVPKEYSSGNSCWQGEITKTGNPHVRRVLVEAAWSYRYKPALKGAIRQRQQGKNPQAQAIAWKAQDRLHWKYFHLAQRGKSHEKVVTAVARELMSFVWTIACVIEQTLNTRIIA